MEVILIENIEKLGTVGDVVKVKMAMLGTILYQKKKYLELIKKI